jgi:hypothetical protein
MLIKCILGRLPTGQKYGTYYNVKEKQTLILEEELNEDFGNSFITIRMYYIDFLPIVLVVEFLARARDFSFLHRGQIGCGAHQVGTGISFLKGLRSQGMKLTTHLHQVLRISNALCFTSICPYMLMVEWLSN